MLVYIGFYQLYIISIVHKIRQQLTVVLIFVQSTPGKQEERERWSDYPRSV